MTPKEKAKKLVDEMLESLYDNGSLSFKRILYAKAKECALITVDELIYSHSQDTTDNQFYYWKEVKQEIEKL